jgi:putative inorganic carbon (hco3(-)) transporter
MTTLPIITTPSRRYRKSPERSKLGQTLVMLLAIAGAGLVLLTGTWFIGSTNQGMVLLAGIAAAITAVIILLRPSVGLYVLMVSIFLNLSSLLEENFGIPDLNKFLAAAVLLAVVGTRIVIQRKPFVFRYTEVVILLYGFVMTLSVLASGGTGPEQFDVALDFLKDFMLIVIIIQLASDEQVFKQAQWVLILSAGFVALLTCFQSITGLYGQTFFGLASVNQDEVSVGAMYYEAIQFARSTGPLGDANYYAQILLMVFPLALYRALNTRDFLTRMVALLCALLIVGAIIFTYSRAGLLGVLFITGAIVLIRRMNLIKIGVIGIVFIGLTFMLPQGYQERFLGLDVLGLGDTRQEEDVSVRGRTSEMIVALQMFQDHPILGIGTGNYSENYLDYSPGVGLDDRRTEREAHSLYLEVVAETGLMGIAAFSLMIAAIFGALWKARQRFNQIGRADLIPWVEATALGLLGYMFTSIFLHAAYMRYFWLSVAIAISVTALADALTAAHRWRQIQQDEDQTNGKLSGGDYFGENTPSSSYL